MRYIRKRKEKLVTVTTTWIPPQALGVWPDPDGSLKLAERYPDGCLITRRGGIIIKAVNSRKPWVEGRGTPQPSVPTPETEKEVSPSKSS